MSFTIEKLDKNMAKLTIEVSVEEFEKAVETAYQKNKGKIEVPGFRKGKVPRQMIEKMYGKEVFFEDAANEVIPVAYEKAYDECEEEIVSAPKIEVTQIEAGKPFIFTAEVALKPEVKLGKYKGIKVDKVDVEVTEEEVNEAIETERKNSARTVSVEDRPIQDGDTTVIDFEGFVDGVAFEGGKGENYPLTIGSHSFIDNFEEQLIGKSINDEVEVNVTFPEDYHAAELKGKPALFKVTVKEIKENQLPDLDDEFAEEVSAYDTFAEYKESVKKNLAEKKEADAKNAKEEAVVEAIIADAEMDIPEAMVATQQRQMVEEFAQRLAMQGLSMEQYSQFTGMTASAMMEQVKPQAEKRIKSRLVLEAVVAAENIEVSDAEYEEELAKMAEMYKMEVEQIKEIMDDERAVEMKKDIAIQKAVEFVVANAKEK
ncbi:MAG: trigger factor [Lachnospiraceae bacterium]|nr:trigger factor [Lachnospiraceae bacterium]